MTVLSDLPLRSATRTIKGVSFPAIIHNGSYFLADIGVYEDGIVDCWGGVDLKLFKKKVSSGWVKTSIPDGAVLSAHHLAHMTVANAQWSMTPRTLSKRVKSIIKALNPDMINLYDMAGEDTDRSGKISLMKVNRMSKATWRNDERMPLLSQPIMGIAQKAFWRANEKIHVVTVSLFDDDQVQITGAGEEVAMSLDALREDERLTTASKGDSVQISGLCNFEIADIGFTIPKDDFLSELEIGRDRLLGRETPVSRAVAVFKAFQENPTTEMLEELRTAYETVPRHMRRYCGNMDSKDIPIRIALYGEQEIENWSHYALAKAKGHDLPSIDTPKLKDS
ncbi:hypothetical protein K3X44_09290 [Aliiroseovarius crassostreae]|uniref:DUF7638 domain-containing protein n=1 Tax=Aliiroseovarius crassostreae TaxID=154981 RepID=UPI00220D1F4F|nr:hypothetical protein [Aliiroseovarius crassostreae]UWQ00724.1 hypothetical protein K3X44_09290 [Aliiroseovarius crassostreae]